MLVRWTLDSPRFPEDIADRFFVLAFGRRSSSPSSLVHKERFFAQQTVISRRRCNNLD
jgi:hypothetical protein